MHASIVLILVFVATSQAANTNRLTGGEEAKPNEFPYLVLIKAVTSDDVVVCSGTILSKEYILTAASCVYNAVQAEIYLGTTIVQDADAQVLYSTEINVHYAFNPIEKIHDIAILKLQDPADFDDAVAAIDLPPYRDVDKTFENEFVYVIGYGSITDAPVDDTWTLHMGETIVRPNQECLVLEDQMCSSKVKGVSLCSGDEGGPMVAVIEGKNIQLGIGSQVSETCDPNDKEPVFTRITSYLDWIHGITGGKILSSTFD